MIWYKSSIQERSSPLGAKMGRGSPVCQQIHEKIIEMFKNNVPQRKIGRDLDISPSTVHNIIKRFKESGGISVRKGQGRKPKLNNCDLRSLRRHCIKNPHSSISVFYKTSFKCCEKEWQHYKVVNALLSFFGMCCRSE